MREEGMPEAREFHPGRASLEERHAQLSLEASNDPTQGRLSEVQRLGGETKASGFDDGQKCFELSWIQSHTEVL